MNEKLLEQANQKAIDKKLSQFQMGYKYHEAFINGCIKKNPNDKKLGALIRKMISEAAKDNPYNEFMEELGQFVNNSIKKKK